VRNKALEYIQRVYPNKLITDTSGSIKALLDLVEEDIVRIQDPTMYGSRIGVVPGKKWREDAKESVIQACKIL
jgi:hypothetical protein